jgi:hypothetical protein
LIFVYPHTVGYGSFDLIKRTLSLCVG